jgi:hypothetical protein
MRIVHTALMSLLLGIAVPSIGVAQVLTSFQSNPMPAYDEGLDHVVPVATVSRVEDIVALDAARTVDDGRGKPFVLGAASLDMSDAAHAKVVFTIANVTQTPVPLNDVEIFEWRVCSTTNARYQGFVAGRAGGYPAGTAELKPGAKVTVQIPIAPSCERPTGIQTQVVVVTVSRRRPSPHETSSTPQPPGDKPLHMEKDLFSRVLERLRAEASHQ